jgi:histidinol-phosphatase (PHP family)
MRGRPEQLEDYLASIRTLQANYHDYIDIHIGMECEYFPALEPELRDLLTSGRCDYLILGLHYLYQNEQGVIEDYSGDITSKEQLLRYGDLACEAMRTGLFTIFAHPDLFMARYPVWDETCEKISRQICEVAKEQEVLLEVNLRGIYFFGEKIYRDGKRFPYPHEAFFKIAKEVGNQVIIGIDAHDPQELTPEQYERGKMFLKSLQYDSIAKINCFKGQS